MTSNGHAARLERLEDLLEVQQVAEVAERHSVDPQRLLALWREMRHLAESGLTFEQIVDRVARERGVDPEVVLAKLEQIRAGRDEEGL